MWKTYDAKYEKEQNGQGKLYLYNWIKYYKRRYRKNLRKMKMSRK